jgi:TetR/AcrR family transcriptional regulator, repressor for uid operon
MAAHSLNTNKRVVEPQQARSRSTHDKIIVAAMTLIRSGDFDEVGFARLLKEAGVSVGTFYGRFKSKEALFEVVLDRFFSETLEWIDSTMAVVEAEARSLDAAIEGVVAAISALFYRDRGFMKAIYLRTRVRTDERLTSKAMAFNLECYGYLESALLRFAGEIRHDDAREAVRFGGKVVASAIREAVFFADGPNIKTMFGRESKIEKDSADLLKRYLRGKVDNYGSGDSNGGGKQTRP